LDDGQDLYLIACHIVAEMPLLSIARIYGERKAHQVRRLRLMRITEQKDLRFPLARDEERENLER